MPTAPNVQHRNTKGTTRSQILGATAVVLGQLPLSKVTMEDIAKAAGLARQTIYKHFANRDELISAMLVDETDRTHRPALQALHAEERSSTQLTRMILEQVRLANEWFLLTRTFDPELAPRIVNLVLSSRPLTQCVETIWIPILTDYQDAAILRDDIDLHETVRWLTYQYVWLLSYPNALTEDPGELANYIDTFVTGALVQR